MNFNSVFFTIVIALQILHVSFGQKNSSSLANVAEGLLKKLSICSSNAEITMTTDEVLKQKAFSTRNYQVTTQDGYILTMTRITGNENGTAVLLQGGLGETSYAWIATGPGNGLAYVLAKQGFDVWLGNSRGTTYSKGHVNKSISPKEYWNFDFHQIGIYDIPAQLNVISENNDKDMIYIGHAMGTTAYFIASILRPEAVSKIKLMVALAPVVYVKHVKGAAKLAADIYGLFEKAGYPFTGTTEILAQGPFSKFAAKCICNHNVLNELCQFFFSSLGGRDQKLDKALLPTIVGHIPGGGSFKDLIHYFQGYLRGGFRFYDYGKTKNLKLYNSTIAPDYPLIDMKTPTAIFYGSADFLADPEDNERLRANIPNLVHYQKVQDYSHFDFLWANDLKDVVYPSILQLIKKHL